MADKSLVMSFLNEEGKKTSVRLTCIKDNLTEAEVSTAMNAVVEKNIFFSTGGDLKTKDSAQIVERNVSELAVR
jgi:hypothetical protein